jgi:hypothetical protein
MALSHDASLTFEGPSLALFALGSSFLSIQSQELETILPTSDFIEFLLYLTETSTPGLFTAPDGPTMFVMDGEILRIHGLQGTEVSIALSDFEAFLQFLTQLSESSTSTKREELSALDRDI